MYSFVLLVVGNFLRTVFKDSSKRMIWEELQDTEVLESLCTGIYLARMKGQLNREYTLYYLLVRIYRSPELLFKVATPKVPLDPHEELEPEGGASPVRDLRPGGGGGADGGLLGPGSAPPSPGPERPGLRPGEGAPSALRRRDAREEVTGARD